MEGLPVTQVLRQEDERRQIEDVTKEFSRMPFDTIQDMSLQLRVPCFKRFGIIEPPLDLSFGEQKTEGETSETLTFTLKQRASAGATSPTYKLKVNRFNEGRVSNFCQLIQAIHKIWRQNSVNTPAD